MKQDDMNWDGDVAFVDMETGVETRSARVIPFPMGGEPLEVDFVDETLLRDAEESISKAVDMSREFSSIYLKIHAAIDSGDLDAQIALRDELKAMRGSYGF